jgi:hypothetical protein
MEGRMRRKTGNVIRWWNNANLLWANLERRIGGIERWRIKGL